MVTSDKTVTKKRYSKFRVLEMMTEYSKNIVLLENISQEMTVSAGIAQYGPQAAEPKAQGGTSDPVFREYKRREKKFQWYGEVSEKVVPIQNFIESPDYENKLEFVNKLILEHTLDGYTQREIGEFVNMSHVAVSKRQQQIAEIISGCNIG